LQVFWLFRQGKKRDEIDRILTHGSGPLPPVTITPLPVAPPPVTITPLPTAQPLGTATPVPLPPPPGKKP
jgi:hypothetical protein